MKLIAVVMVAMVLLRCSDEEILDTGAERLVVVELLSVQLLELNWGFIKISTKNGKENVNWRDPVRGNA